MRYAETPYTTRYEKAFDRLMERVESILAEQVLTWKEIAGNRSNQLPVKVPGEGWQTAE